MSRKKKPSRDLEGIMVFLETVPFHYKIDDTIVYFEVTNDIGFHLPIGLALDTFILKYGRLARACQERYYGTTD